MEAVLVETLFDPLVLSNTSDMHVREAFNFVFKGMIGDSKVMGYGLWVMDVMCDYALSCTCAGCRFLTWFYAENSLPY